VSGVRQRDRAALGAHLRMSGAIALTAWAAMWSWRGFTLMPARYIVALVAVALAVALTGALGRWRRLPGVVVVLAQLVVGGAVTCQVVASRPYPGDRFWSMLSAALDAANAYASPVPQTDEISVQPLLVVGGFVAVLLVDVLAGTLRRVPLSGLPLLAVYSVPISLVDRGLSWWVFAATAASFLLMLFLQEEEHLSRWGRSLDGNTEPVRRLSDSVRASALSIGATATAAAVLLPLAIPTFSFSVFDVGPGRGDDGEIEVTNPMVDLRQDLVRGEDVDLVTIRTDDLDPAYLRISVLNRFTDNEWSAGDRSVPDANLAQGEVPLSGDDPGLVSYRDVDYDVKVSDAFRSRWLPTQAPISEIDAPGDWRFDDSTMDFLSGDDDLDTAGLDYSMTAAAPTYDDDRLLKQNTSTAAVSPDLTELPDDLPPGIGAYAREATKGATTDFERAVLLNRFFRETGGFTYALPTDPEGGVGTGELVDFLTPGNGGRTGYCEQFAAAMGVMARDLGIPARVAVGFLKPDRVRGSDSWVYSAHDLHAWVELYFPGAGWVLFDPTPADRTGSSQPGYADAPVDVSEPTQTATTAAPRESADPRERPSVSAAPRPEGPAASGPDGADTGSSFPWLVVLALLAVVLVVGLLVLLPRALRRRQRDRRLAGGPEAAWEELRATAVDLRLAWPDHRSPRETRDLVVQWFGRPDDPDERPARGPRHAPEAVEALGRIVDRLERVRYSRGHVVEPGSLRADVLTTAGAITAGATPRRRRQARWLPVSVLQRRPTVEADDATAPSGEPELVGGHTEVL
jgi:transglutaminase-like putative cysteine protease